MRIAVGEGGVRHGRKSRTQLREISQKSQKSGYIEIRNQGLENPVEIRKSARNPEITRETPLFCLRMSKSKFHLPWIYRMKERKQKVKDEVNDEHARVYYVVIYHK